MWFVWTGSWFGLCGLWYTIGLVYGCHWLVWLCWLFSCVMLACLRLVLCFGRLVVFWQLFVFGVCLRVVWWIVMLFTWFCGFGLRWLRWLVWFVVIL